MADEHDLSLVAMMLGVDPKDARPGGAVGRYLSGDELLRARVLWLEGKGPMPEARPLPRSHPLLSQLQGHAGRS